MSNFNVGDRVRVKENYPSDYEYPASDTSLMIGREGTVEGGSFGYIDVELDVLPEGSSNPLLFYPDELELL